MDWGHEIANELMDFPCWLVLVHFVYGIKSPKCASIKSILQWCMASIPKVFHDHKEFKKNASDLSEDISSKGQRLSENSTCF